MNKKIVPVGNMTVDRVVRNGELIGYNPGGITNLCMAWSAMTNPRNIVPVCKIGDDDYSRHIRGRLAELGLDQSYVSILENAESRLVEIDVTDSQNPRITRKQDAEKIMKTPYKDLTKLLPGADVLFFQSFASIFETAYADFTIETIEKANSLGVPVVLDNNIRQPSVANVSLMKKQQERVYPKLDMIKLNEGEAAVMINPSEKTPIENITLKENHISKYAEQISETWGIKNVAITLGNRGSFILTPNGEKRYDSIKPENFINSLGAGDAWCAGYVMKYHSGLTENEAGFLATLLGSMATECPTAYPSHITKKSIADGIIKNHLEYGIAADSLLKKLAMKQ